MIILSVASSQCQQGSRCDPCDHYAKCSFFSMPGGRFVCAAVGKCKQQVCCKDLSRQLKISPQLAQSYPAAEYGKLHRSDHVVLRASCRRYSRVPILSDDLKSSLKKWVCSLDRDHILKMLVPRGSFSFDARRVSARSFLSACDRCCMSRKVGTARILRGSLGNFSRCPTP